MSMVGDEGNGLTNVQVGGPAKKKYSEQEAGLQEQNRRGTTGAKA
jgi:hypothetical protein